MKNHKKKHKRIAVAQEPSYWLVVWPKDKYWKGSPFVDSMYPTREKARKAIKELIDAYGSVGDVPKNPIVVSCEAWILHAYR